MNIKKALLMSVALIYASLKIFIILISAGYLARYVLLYMLNGVIWTINKTSEVTAAYYTEVEINGLSLLVIIFFTLLIAYLIFNILKDPVEKYLMKKLKTM